jgi:hypothetical protein
MTDNHPITVPAGSITGWKLLYCNYQGDLSETEYIVLKSAQWGADKELGACCELLRQFGFNETVPRLQRVRRPEPPSLKEQALADLYDIYTSQPFPVGDNRFNCIRRALEALPE